MNAMKATPKKRRKKGGSDAEGAVSESQGTAGELAAAEAYIPDLMDAAGLAEAADAAPELAEEAVAEAGIEEAAAVDSAADAGSVEAEAESVGELVADTAEAGAEQAAAVEASVEAASPDEGVPVLEAASVTEAAEPGAEPVAAGLPCPVGVTPEELEDEAVVERVEHLAKDVAWVLIAAGVIGIVMPGVLGTPFLIAGAAAMWPGNHKRLEKWRQGHAPKMFHGGMKQINRFLDDLERRYPRDGSKRRDG